MEQEIGTKRRKSVKEMKERPKEIKGKDWRGNERKKRLGNWKRSRNKRKRRIMK